MKKALSVFLTVLFVLSGFYVNGSVEIKVNSESTNLIVNGGFEGELNEKGYVNGWGEGWRGIGDMLPERIKSEGHSGSFSASVSANYNCYIYTEFECEENTDYILTFWTKGAKNMACTVTPPFSPTGDQTMFAAGKQPENAIFKESLSDSTDWQLNTYSFNSGANTKLSVVFSTLWTGSASNLFDDIEVIKDPDFGQIVKNGGFEKGTAKWASLWTTSLNSDKIIEGDAHTGNYSATVGNGTNEYIYTEFECEKNTDYIMTFWHKGTGSSMSYNITQPFEFKTYLNNMVKIASGGIPDSDEWQQMTISFNSGDNVQLCLVLANSYVNMNDTNRFDDIYITVDPDNGKIIKNGGFERDLAGWSYWNVNSTVSDVAYEGEKSLLLAITESQVYPGFYQEFNVEANTDYRLKFTYKGTGSWQSVWAVTETGMLTVDNALLTDSLYSKEDWTNVDCIFNSGEHTKLRIWFRGGVSSEIYLDAISIEKYEKTKPGAPEAPTISEHTQSSVTLNEVLGYEYSLDGINYSTNPTFTGLFTGMEYSFYQRIQADEFNLPSDVSAAAVYKITAYGDANDDGEIKSDDIAQIVKVLFGSVSEYSQDGCDSNGDKMIDIRDLVNLKKKLAENTVDSSFILFGRDISDYVIAYSGDDNNVQDGINALNTAVDGRSGQKLPVVSERTENTPAIILNIDDDYADSYSVKSDINNCLSVSAGTAELINNALTVLAERITEYPKELTLSITEDYLLELDWKAALSNYKLIAFTFDDAPHYSSVGDNRTTKIINTFKKYNGAATFFVIGSAFDNYGTSLMQYALDNGFELGNHGNTHVNLVGKTKEEIREEIVTLNDYVKDTYGYTMKFFRPSGIGTDENVFSVATELGMPVISGSRHNDLRDWDAETTAESIKEKCLAGAYDGQIVLMHAGSKSAEVIDEICAALYSQGYRFVTLSELFKYKNIAFEDIPTDHLIYDSGLN